MTRCPKAGKGKKWTTLELKAMPPDWRGDTLSDGDGLIGEVVGDLVGVVAHGKRVHQGVFLRELNDGFISNFFVHGFAFDGEVKV